MIVEVHKMRCSVRLQWRLFQADNEVQGVCFKCRECLHMGVIGPCACGSGSARRCAIYADARVQIDVVS